MADADTIDLRSEFNPPPASPTLTTGNDSVNLRAEFNPPQPQSLTSTDLRSQFDPPKPEDKDQSQEDILHPLATEAGREKWNSSTPLERLGILLSHPWDKYVASVDQAFQGPQIPRVEAPKEGGVVNRAEQLGAALDNTFTGIASGLASRGGIATLANPESAVYAAPRFIAGGMQSLMGTANQPTAQQKIESVLSGGLMVAGGSHLGVKGVTDLLPESIPEPEAKPAITPIESIPKREPTPEEAKAMSQQLQDQAKAASTPGEQVALETASDAVAKLHSNAESSPLQNGVPTAKSEEGPLKPLPDNAIVKIPGPGEIGTPTITIPGAPGGTPRFEGAREPAPEFHGTPEEARAAGYAVDLKSEFEKPQPEEVKPMSLAPEPEQKISDYARYHDINAQLDKMKSDQGIQAANDPKYQELWKERNDILNRNPNAPGMPPMAPATDFSEEGLAKASSTETPAQTPELPVIPPNKEVLADSSGGETPNYGIAARVSDTLAEGGHIEPIEAGEGASPEELIQHGRDLIDAGRDPQDVLKEVQDAKRFNSEDMAVLRAHGEDLFQAADAAADKFGVNSDEYKAARQASSDWQKNAIKPMQTDWAKSGAVQQGETEVDTGSFHGLERDYREATGKDFTEGQAKRANEIKDQVQSARAAEEAAKQKTLDMISKVLPDTPATKGIGMADYFKDSAAAARERIKARLTSGRVSAGLDPQDIADHAIIGAEYIAKGIDVSAEWSKAMLNEFGDRIKPYLKQIRDASDTTAEKAKKAVEQGSVKDIWNRAKSYIDSGVKDFDDIRQKIAKDTGLSMQEVSEKLASPKGSKAITNDMYAKTSARRAVEAAARDWVTNQRMPGWQRFAQKLPRAFFRLATLAHPTVWAVTHTAPEIFKPHDWAQLWPNYVKAFRLAGVHDGGAYHAQMMADLQRDPNYITARRAGLENDPSKRVDDYQKAWLGGWFGKLGAIGNRGFDGLKLLRQDLFNKHWDDLDPAMKTKDQAAMMSDAINHSTGATSVRFPEWMNWSFFAPKLAASQWQWMITDPAKAAKILTPSYWADATPAEKSLAIGQLKEKATVAGFYATLLAANQGLLSASGSKQSINYTNPTRSDFLKFKAGGQTIGVGSPMLGNVRLLTSLINSATGHPAPYQKHESVQDQMGNAVLDYARSKLSPFAGTVADVFTRSDFEGRPMPFSNAPVKPSLRRQGIYSGYTLPEYLAQKLPIPLAETIHDVWKSQGMDETTMDHWISAITAGTVSGLTGARVSKDTNPTGQ
jgi:hypothetical protein